MITSFENVIFFELKKICEKLFYIEKICERFFQFEINSKYQNKIKYQFDQLNNRQRD